MAQANHDTTAPAPEAHPVPTDPWPIPPAVQAARKMVFEIRSRLESNLNAIENYAKMLTIASTSDGVTELHGFAISQISRDISKRVETIWDGDIADLMKMLRPELQHYWKFGVIENEDGDDDDGNGDVEESASEAGGDVGLIALGERLTIAYAAEREAFARDCSYEEGDMLHKACSKIARQIEKVPATTLAGLRVKATAIDWCCGGKPFADADDTTDKRLVTSLLTDLHAMTAAAQ